MNKPPVFVHLRRGDQRLGPYELAQLSAFAAEGRLLPGDVARREGETGWQALPLFLQRHGIAVPPGGAAGWPVPGQRSSLAVAAGVATLLSLLIVPAPVVLVLGVLALRDLRLHPERVGRKRAWAAVVAGGLITLGAALVVRWWFAGFLR